METNLNSENGRRGGSGRGGFKKVRSLLKPGKVWETFGNNKDLEDQQDQLVKESLSG